MGSGQIAQQTAYTSESDRCQQVTSSYAEFRSKYRCSSDDHEYILYVYVSFMMALYHVIHGSKGNGYDEFLGAVIQSDHSLPSFTPIDLESCNILFCHIYRTVLQPGKLVPRAMVPSLEDISQGAYTIRSFLEQSIDALETVMVEFHSKRLLQHHETQYIIDEFGPYLREESQQFLHTLLEQ